jgi:hypothetical protein
VYFASPKPHLEYVIELWDALGKKLKILDAGKFEGSAPFSITYSWDNHYPGGLYYIRANLGGIGYALPLLIQR